MKDFKIFAKFTFCLFITALSWNSAYGGTAALLGDEVAFTDVYNQIQWAQLVITKDAVVRNRKAGFLNFGRHPECSFFASTRQNPLVLHKGKTWIANHVEFDTSKVDFHLENDGKSLLLRCRVFENKSHKKMESPIRIGDVRKLLESLGIEARFRGAVNEGNPGIRQHEDTLGAPVEIQLRSK